MSYAFLSYARSDADLYFETFYNDFVKELRGRVGDHTTNDLVFRDSSDIPLGAEWEPMLEQKLLTCRTFIAMLSPTYLRRPACHKEWASFEWRLQRWESSTPSDLLLPLVWIPIPKEDLPPAIRARQSAHASFGDTYARRGLRNVVQRGGTEYQDLLTTLAERVRDLVRGHTPQSPPKLMAPNKLPNPFEIENPIASATSASALTKASGPKSAGPKHVEFIVVAAHQAELRTERRAVSAYGADFDEWCPFLPVLATRVGLLIQKIAIEQNLTASVLPVAQDLVAHLQSARAKNMLVVLVVDVWSLRLPTYRSYMNLFDRAERFTNAGALVVWNLADDETLDRKHELLDALGVAFPNLSIMPDPPAFHHQLGTPDELAEKLCATLCELRRRISNFGEVMRKAEGISPISKPLLTGPGAV